MAYMGRSDQWLEDLEGWVFTNCAVLASLLNSIIVFSL